MSDTAKIVDGDNSFTIKRLNDHNKVEIVIIHEETTINIEASFMDTVANWDALHSLEHPDRSVKYFCPLPNKFRVSGFESPNDIFRYVPLMLNSQYGLVLTLEFSRIENENDPITVSLEIRTGEHDNMQWSMTHRDSPPLENLIFKATFTSDLPTVKAYAQLMS